MVMQLGRNKCGLYVPEQEMFLDERFPLAMYYLIPMQEIQYKLLSEVPPFPIFFP